MTARHLLPSPHRTGIWAAVPVKSLGAAKQRLAAVLSPDQRRRLVLAMLSDVLDALAGTAGLAGTLVVSPDIDVLRLAGDAGAVCVAQAGDIGFAASADAAARVAATTCRAAGVMIVPADVPRAGPADFTAVIAAHAGGCTVVPAWDGAGSNCVLLSPPTAMGFLFGQDSCARHKQAAEAAGLPVRVVHRPGLSRDIDTPDDLYQAAHLPCSRHMRGFLQTLHPVQAPSLAVCLHGRP